MVQIPQQVLTNLNLHLTADAPSSPDIGYEEEYTHRRREEGMMGDEEDMYSEQRQSMYGEETSPDYYDEESYSEEDDTDYGRTNDDYSREYRENVSLSNFGYSPDIIGGDLINYDTPYSNNDFENREIIDNGGNPYGDWWRLENVLGDVNIAKGASKNDMNDLFGLGISNMSDVVGISNERVGQASFNDLFGFSGVNSRGTLGVGDEYDPQTMFGLKEIAGAIKEKAGVIKEKASAVKDKINDISTNIKVKSSEKNLLKELDKYEKEKADEASEKEIDEMLNEAREKQKEMDSEVDSDESKDKNVFQKFGDKLKEKTDEIKESREKSKELKADVYKKLAEQGINPYAKNSAPKSSFDDFGGGFGHSSRYRGLGLGLGGYDDDESASKKKDDMFGFDKFGNGEADIIGFSSANNMGEPDIFGFQHSNVGGEQDTFGFRSLGNAGGSAQSQFGFNLANGTQQQTSEDVFGFSFGAGVQGEQRPMTFSETFGFKIGDETPQQSVQQPVQPQEPQQQKPVRSQEVRANLSTMQTSAPQRTVYRTSYKPDNRPKRRYEFPVQSQPVSQPTSQLVPVESPQRHEGMYNRVGRILGDNQDYASNFNGYGYSLDVGGMLGGSDDRQMIGFNSDVLGIGAIPKSRKVRVTSFTIEGGKVTKRSTKVNGKYIEKKKKSTKGKKKSGKSKRTKTVKAQKNKSKQDDYFNSLIWG